MLRRIKQPTFAELYAPRLITVLREGIARAVADIKGERARETFDRGGRSRRKLASRGRCFSRGRTFQFNRFRENCDVGARSTVPISVTWHRSSRGA
jgi:hypothetical protein